jgi:hypothetical protein
VATTVDLHLAGTGTPGATVSAAVAGAVYTTVVASNGSWAINIAALPQNTTGADATISQKTTGLIGGLLGALIPLQVSVNTLGLHVSLLN